MFGLSGAAAGGADALEQILKQKFLEMVQQRELQQRQQTIDQQGQRDTVNAELGRGDLALKGELGRGNLQLGGRRVALDESQFGEDNRRYGIEQPIRGRLTIAQAAELERKPQAEQADRDFTVQRDATRNKYELGQIGAQGAEQRRTASLRLAGSQPQAQSSDTYTDERGARIRQSVAELKNKITNWTAGAGSALSGIPATPARNFKAELDSLKANIAFGELAEMRAASKTGGALGAVSERELALLESTLGALDQGQSPQNLSAQLDRIVGVLDRWQAAKSGKLSTAGAPPVQNMNDQAQEFDYVPGKGLVPRVRK
jgi:hypothetical protein